MKFQETSTLEQAVAPGALILPGRTKPCEKLSGKYPALEEKNFVLRAFELLAKTRPMKNPLVLDVGTGAAKIPIRFVHQLSPANLVALDISHAMLKKARENIQAKRLTRKIFLVCADAERLPFRSGTFDLVCSHSLLRRLSDPLHYLEEIVRVTRKGCRFLIRDLRRPPLNLLDWYVRLFGMGLDGYRKKIFRESLLSGLNNRELKQLIRGVKGASCRASGFFITHIGLEGIRTKADLDPRREQRSPDKNTGGVELTLSGRLA
ncbi:MAG: hypothetical protein A2Z86_00585 [Candidatus Glassbacteria bacterium GWA2_58_10]|uniref:Methyltransferase type 11 domain-containing protein n=1 Tax=Candidatus Glassbacteria bacterium GWA2_58_10 TaxID=1817865 RepID=A0A1F5YHG9_9BACT|nr:MAG: hypothetical protein A2Z86_00585 [Candidatus Glassbacteria bacterium GWA2_58_10]